MTGRLAVAIARNWRIRIRLEHLRHGILFGRPLPSPHMGLRPFSSGAKDDHALFASDMLFPPPTGESILKRGMPLLARAAHHARMGRTLAYDLHGRNCLENGLDPAAGGDTKVAYSYHEVLSMSTHLHEFFKAARSREGIPTADDPAGKMPQRIVFLCPPGPGYVAVQFAAWSSGSVAVPLCVSHRRGELAYVLKDCDPAFVVDGTMSPSEGRELRMAAREAGAMDRYWLLDDMMEGYEERRPERQLERDGAGGNASKGYALGSNGDIPGSDHPALIIYTSGTTGNPKGVVHTHRNIYHQITDLVTSWGWSHRDSILHFLPLHHVHGVINKLGCAIWAGASVQFVKFHPVRIWERLAEETRRRRGAGPNNQFNDCDDNDPSPQTPGTRTAPVEGAENGTPDSCPGGDELPPEPTLFMAVPTIYAKMLEVVPQLPRKSNPSEAMRSSSIRLMVSGSAALPAGIFERWKALTGHTILERYGMTEFAMALSNPLDPIEKRLPGYVGSPLPSVEVKIVDEDSGEKIMTMPGSPPRSGELCVRGPAVFSKYWRKPRATAEAFDSEGFFKTGDVAEYDPISDSYHILGRLSADIIKCAGHKLSSLQIERTLLEHPLVVEAAVLGVPDETYGERVGLICRLTKSGDESSTLDLSALRRWCEDRMAPYKIPSRMIVVEDDIPKNAMGKVSKKQLVHLFKREGDVQY